MCLYQVSSNFLKYYDYPTSSTSGVVAGRRLEFPAVTFCNMNPVRKSQMNETVMVSANLIYGMHGFLLPRGVIFRHISWTQWGRETHTCVSKLTIIGSDNGWSVPAFIWSNAGILLIRTIVTNFSEILSAIHINSLKCIWKCHLWNGGNLSRVQYVICIPADDPAIHLARSSNKSAWHWMCRKNRPYQIMHN